MGGSKNATTEVGSRRVNLATDNTTSIDRFIDALWIEDGLSKNTLEAYRRDLTLYAASLAAEQGHALAATTEVDLLAYAVARHEGRKCSRSAHRK